MKHKTITTNFQQFAHGHNDDDIIDKKIAEASQKHDKKVNDFLDEMEREYDHTSFAVKTTPSIQVEGASTTFTLVTIITYSE